MTYIYLALYTADFVSIQVLQSYVFRKDDNQYLGLLITLNILKLCMTTTLGVCTIVFARKLQGIITLLSQELGSESH